MQDEKVYRRLPHGTKLADLFHAEFQGAWQIPLYSPRLIVFSKIPAYNVD